MSEERPIVICITTDRPPAVSGATREYCELCAEEVWVAPSSKAIAPNIMTVCDQCAPGLIAMDPNPQIMVTPEQLAELRREGWV